MATRCAPRWERIATSDANSRFIGADEVKHSFVRKGQETRVTQITFDGEKWEVISGLKDLIVMNSTNSEFWGYVKDKYTTFLTPKQYAELNEGLEGANFSGVLVITCSVPRGTRKSPG